MWDECNCVAVRAFFAMASQGLEWKLTFSRPLATAEFSKFAGVLGDHFHSTNFSVHSVQSVSHDRLFVTPWTAARQASLSITNSHYPNPCPLSQWCHPTISSSVVSFSSCPQSFPASGSFLMSQLFTSGGQSIGVSASTSVLQWTPRTDLF